MKTTIVLVALISGVNSCDGKADSSYIKQPYENLEECKEMAKSLVLFDHVKRAECIVTIQATGEIK